MDEKLYELLKDQPFWRWLPPEGGRYFDACFNMDAETVPAGQHRQSAGRVGYLISGRARVNGDPAGEGTFFGVKGDRSAEEADLWAVTECKVLWLDGDVLRHVCYAACWFHARLIREVDAYFQA